MPYKKLNATELCPSLMPALLGVMGIAIMRVFELVVIKMAPHH